MEDEQIIELYFARDASAINHTQNKYGRLIKSLTFSILNSNEDAEEAENDTYLAVWNSVPPTYPNNLCAYVCRVAKNLSIKKDKYNRADKRSSELSISIDELYDTLTNGKSTENEVDAKELATYINKFLSQLTINKRTVFMRRYWFGNSVEEIANLTGESQSKIKSILFRLRKNLKENLIKEGILL